MAKGKKGKGNIAQRRATITENGENTIFNAKELGDFIVSYMEIQGYEYQKGYVEFKSTDSTDIRLYSGNEKSMGIYPIDDVLIITDPDTLKNMKAKLSNYEKFTEFYIKAQKEGNPIILQGDTVNVYDPGTQGLKPQFQSDPLFGALIDIINKRAASPTKPVSKIIEEYLKKERKLKGCNNKNLAKTG